MAELEGNKNDELNKQHFTEKMPLENAMLDKIISETLTGRQPKSLSVEECKQYKLSDQQVNGLLNKEITSRHKIVIMKLFDVEKGLDKLKDHEANIRGIDKNKTNLGKNLSNTLQKAANGIEKNARGMKID